MSIVGYRAKNHPQQTRHGANDSIDDRGTTDEVFLPLHRRYVFTVDVAASSQNAKLPRYFDRDTDGLSRPWGGERVWCNPPYSNVRPWIEKAWAEEGAEIVAMLLPANRTEQGWWQDLIEPHRDRARSPLTTEFLRGRIRFLAPGATTIGPNERPPFGCVLLVWDRTKAAL